MNHKEPTDAQAPSQKRCKICGEPLSKPGHSELGPFCSERCRMNDLSKWFGENYRIASDPVPNHEQQVDDEQADAEDHK